MEEEDSLLWAKTDCGGSYTPNLCYKALREEELQPETKWWFKIL